MSVKHRLMAWLYNQTYSGIEVATLRRQSEERGFQRGWAAGWTASAESARRRGTLPIGHWLDDDLDDLP